MKILAILLEMGGKSLDLGGKKSNLILWRTSVFVVSLHVTGYFFLLLVWEGHRACVSYCLAQSVTGPNSARCIKISSCNLTRFPKLCKALYKWFETRIACLGGDGIPSVTNLARCCRQPKQKSLAIFFNGWWIGYDRFRVSTPAWIRPLIPMRTNPPCIYEMPLSGKQLSLNHKAWPFDGDLFHRRFLMTEKKILGLYWFTLCLSNKKPPHKRRFLGTLTLVTAP